MPCYPYTMCMHIHAMPCHAIRIVHLPAMPCQRCEHLPAQAVAGAKTLLPATAILVKRRLIKTCDWDKTSESTCDTQWWVYRQVRPNLFLAQTLPRPKPKDSTVCNCWWCPVSREVEHIGDARRNIQVARSVNGHIIQEVSAYCVFGSTCSSCQNLIHNS